MTADRHVAICVPGRRLPVGPPSSISLQSTAAILATGDPHVRRLAADGALRAITGHGELELPDGCILRIALPRRPHTYGLGMSLPRLIRQPLDAAGTTTLPRRRDA